MTQFTRIIIDPNHRHTRWALQSLERMHAIVARTMDPHGILDARGLWRLDLGRAGKPCRLYIVSDNVPDFTVLNEEFGIGTEAVATCSYEPFLGNLDVGQEWGFRLKANPTRSIASGSSAKRGRRVGLVKVEDQLEWLYRKARESGFHMPINRLEMPEVMVRNSETVDFVRKNGTVAFASATYDGVLAVDDPELLRKALTCGIGRAKGYGFGLLTLVPLPKGR
ncbi:type I-E CRISPR-associated protein Cas6/Cse3/CasE [Bifidobacterium simiarum]|uniref:type I-E CRISPR-associated protein Cas6/Cse3/CasE n=1 Tax=Bifidobacterium simiarum TaxID=2045441 RepID=UPI001BDBE6D9|nr:type I-E CRISPR-associated protein Cas6/Cse3/CasE [Bifidobacterium simiarum]MBT1165786.1 type I-E CRISPR-associated protein Cas6/Cse3/CasE [Bifidobacterium simiarum]